LQRQERIKIADAFKEEWYAEDEYIIHEGDKTGDRFYLISEG
jgi:hypothetical protein